MRTIALALLAGSVAFGQEAAPAPRGSKPADATQAPAQPAVPARPSEPLPKAGDISPDVQAVLERATAAYHGCKTYREVVLTSLQQRVSGIDKETQPPVDQASQTSMAWAGPEKFAFDNRDFSLFRNGKEATIVVKSIGEYVQREPGAEDRAVFANMVDMHPVYQTLVGNSDGAGSGGEPVKPGKGAFGRLLSAKDVRAEELRGVKGKRVSGMGLAPLAQFTRPVPVTLFFAEDTGLLVQATYDLKAVMQARYDRAYADMQASGEPAGAKATIERFVITSDWTVAKLDPAGGDEITDGALTLKPSKGETKVEQFNMQDGAESAQYKLLNQPAPEFSATTLDGSPWSLKDQRGKVVVLQFWSASSPRSLSSLSAFNSTDTDYKGRGTVVVGVNEDHVSLVEQSKAVAKRKLAAFTMLADGEKAVGNAYRVGVLPCTILIDKEGVVRSITNDFDPGDTAVVARRLDRLLAGRPVDDDAQVPLPKPPQTAPAEPASPAPAPSAPGGEPKKP
ncbi:MAG: redoxin domain-containing protein [Phycisphaerales bacterium]